MNACRNGTTISFVDEKNIDSCHRTTRQSDGIIRCFVGITRSFDRVISHIDVIIRSCDRTIHSCDRIIRHFAGILPRFDEIIRRFDGIIRRFEVNYSQSRRELSAVSSRIIGRFDEILTIFCDI